MWTQYKGDYRDALVSCDMGLDDWHWTIRMFHQGTNSLKFFKQGVAETPAQAEYTMQQEIDHFLDGDGT